MVGGEHTRTQHAAESRTLRRCKLRQSICSLQALPPACLIQPNCARPATACQPCNPAGDTNTHLSSFSRSSAVKM